MLENMLNVSSGLSTFIGAVSSHPTRCSRDATTPCGTGFLVADGPGARLEGVSEPRSSNTPSEPILIEPRLYAVRAPIPYPMGFVNVLVDVTDPVTLVDCAIDTPEARDALERGLAALSLGWTDIRRVIVTHHHPDHYGLAGWIEQRSGATIRMLALDFERGARFWSEHETWLQDHVAHYLRHGLPETMRDDLVRDSRLTRQRVHPAQTIHPLEAGDHVVLAGLEFEVLWLPGHADGHLGLWHAASRLLIAGDAILERITPNIGLWALSRPDPLGDYLNTLQTIQQLNPIRALIGHYGPILTEPAARAAEIATHHAARLEQLRDLPRAMNAFQASFVLFPQDLNPSGRRFAMTETLAHLEYLRLRGEVEGEPDADGVFQFFVS